MPLTTSKLQRSTKALSAPVFDIAGKELRTMELAGSLFSEPSNASLVSEVLVSAQANQRHPIAHTLSRGDVRGGGKKPWRQKGTGRARQGSTRSPQWRHGGVAFGPKNVQNFTRKINAKARQSVVRMLLSSLAQAGQISLVDGLAFTSTKQAAQFLNTTGTAARRPLFVTATANRELLRSARNLDGVMIRSLERFGLLDLALTDQLTLDLAALEPLVARYASKKLEARSSKLGKSEVVSNPNLQTPASSLSVSKRSEKKTVKPTVATKGSHE